jgi:hypothetical protein
VFDALSPMMQLSAVYSSQLPSTSEDHLSPPQTEDQSSRVELSGYISENIYSQSIRRFFEYKHKIARYSSGGNSYVYTVN